MWKPDGAEFSGISPSNLIEILKAKYFLTQLPVSLPMKKIPRPFEFTQDSYLFRNCLKGLGPYSEQEQWALFSQMA